MECSHPDSNVYTEDNQRAWNKTAPEYDKEHTTWIDGHLHDGTDMFQECVLLAIDRLVKYQPGDTILELGCGTGVVTRRFAEKGAYVTGLDFSEASLKIARGHVNEQRHGSRLTYGRIDLTDLEGMMAFTENKGKNGQENKFDIITIILTLKSLPDLQPLAKALPSMMRPNGRVIIVDLHPAFSKPVTRRCVETHEDPKTGERCHDRYMISKQYLRIDPVRSKAVQKQEESLWFFHRPLNKLFRPFYEEGFMQDAMEEPGFEGPLRPNEPLSYHNFQQFPMVLAVRLVHKSQFQRSLLEQLAC